MCIWKAQPKSLIIRHARSPQNGVSLSGVVHLRDRGSDSCYIAFNQDAVNIIGRGMPYGVGPHTQAYLKVIRQANGLYGVFCCYLDKSATVKLWEQQGMPKWTGPDTARLRLRAARLKTISKQDK